jgi:hypothetical protein
VSIHEARSLKKIPACFGPGLVEPRLTNTGIKTAPDTSVSPRAKVTIG